MDRTGVPSITGCYLPWCCAKSGPFHSCCPSPVLDILLEILWNLLYIAIHKFKFPVILHIFKMSYQLRNIEQCYLPGKMADNMHSHEKSDHLMSILPPALFPHSYPHSCWCFLTHFYLDSHLWALNQLSVLFLAVSDCQNSQKSENLQILCLSVVFSLFPWTTTGAIWLSSIYIHISEHQICSLCRFWLFHKRWFKTR